MKLIMMVENAGPIDVGRANRMFEALSTRQASWRPRDRREALRLAHQVGSHPDLMLTVIVNDYKVPLTENRESGVYFSDTHVDDRISWIDYYDYSGEIVLDEEMAADLGHSFFVEGDMLVMDFGGWQG